MNNSSGIVFTQNRAGMCYRDISGVHKSGSIRIAQLWFYHTPIQIPLWMHIQTVLLHVSASFLLVWGHSHYKIFSTVHACWMHVSRTLRKGHPVMFWGHCCHGRTSVTYATRLHECLMWQAILKHLKGINTVICLRTSIFLKLAPARCSSKKGQ